MLINKKISYIQYIKNCYKRNKKYGCHKQMNGYPLCDGCPKLEGKQ